VIVGVEGTCAGNKVCEFYASGPDRFDFWCNDSGFVFFAGAGCEAWFEVTIAIFPGLGKMSWEFGGWRHC
jgi:hypothetical protein